MKTGLDVPSTQFREKLNFRFALLFIFIYLTDYLYYISIYLGDTRTIILYICWFKIIILVNHISFNVNRYTDFLITSELDYVYYSDANMVYGMAWYGMLCAFSLLLPHVKGVWSVLKFFLTEPFRAEGTPHPPHVSSNTTGSLWEGSVGYEFYANNEIWTR